MRCESGWTGDRCTFALFHEGPHSNETVHEHRLAYCSRCGERHCRCLTCDEVAEYMAADEQLLRYAIG